MRLISAKSATVTTLAVGAGLLYLIAAAQAPGAPQWNTLPVANAGLDQSVVAGDTVALDGAGSYDIDGDKLKFHWGLVSFPAGSTAQLSDSHAVKPAFVADLPGTYEFELVVFDDKTQSAPDLVRVTTDNSPFRPLPRCSGPARSAWWRAASAPGAQPVRP